MPPKKRGRRPSPGPSTPTKRARPEIQLDPDGAEPERAGGVTSEEDVSALSALPPSTLEKYLPQAKREILRVLCGGLPPSIEGPQGKGGQCLGLEEQYASVNSALEGTIRGGEGNSILLVGAHGSGKSLVLESVLRGYTKGKALVVRLDAALQNTDRLSMRELARQLIRLGALRLPKTPEEEAALGLMKGDEENAQIEEGHEGEEDGELGGKENGGDKGGEENGVKDEEREAMAGAVLSSIANTTSTILSLLSNSETNAGPIIIVLSSFELYTTRPRQALLYVLLDAVQAGSYAPGLAVVGMTSRLGVTDLLEKRVRSRFSGRVVNFTPRMDLASKAVEQALRAGQISQDKDTKEARDFNEAWTKEVDRVKEAELDDWEGLDELVELTSIRDVYNSVLPKLAKLSSTNISLVSLLSSSFEPTPAPDRILLRSLTSLEFALLVSARHLQIKGREMTFNFEMLLWQLKSFVARLDRDRQGLIASSASSPTNSATGQAASPGEGLQTRRKNWAKTGGISSGFADRTRAMMAFRNLINLELFLPEHTITSSGRTTTKRAPLPRTEFVYVRLAIFPSDIVNIVNDDVERRDTLGTSLVQWARSAG